MKAHDDPDPESGKKSKGDCADAAAADVAAANMTSSGKNSHDNNNSNTVITHYQYPLCETRLKFYCFQDDIRFNPLVSLIALVSLGGLASYCMAQPDEANVTLQKWFHTVVDYCTWFYIGTCANNNCTLLNSNCSQLVTSCLAHPTSIYFSPYLHTITTTHLI